MLLVLLCAVLVCECYHLDQEVLNTRIGVPYIASDTKGGTPYFASGFLTNSVNFKFRHVHIQRSARYPGADENPRTSVSYGFMEMDTAGREPMGVCRQEFERLVDMYLLDDQIPPFPWVYSTRNTPIQGAGDLNFKAGQTDGSVVAHTF
jgi:hypothetical protein